MLNVVMHCVALSRAVPITFTRVDTRESLVADRRLRVEIQSVVMRNVMHSRSRALPLTVNTIKVRLTRLRLVERQLALATMQRAVSGSAACTRVRRTILSSLVTRISHVALPLRVRTLYVAMHSAALFRAARAT